MKDRRKSTEFDCTFDGKRRGDKIASFVFFMLLVFLINWAIGCGGVRVKTGVIYPPDCNVFPNDFRCKSYVPQHDVELDDFDVLDDTDF